MEATPSKIPSPLLQALSLLLRAVPLLTLRPSSLGKLSVPPPASHLTLQKTPKASVLILAQAGVFRIQITSTMLPSPCKTEEWRVMQDTAFLLGVSMLPLQQLLPMAVISFTHMAPFMQFYQSPPNSARSLSEGG